MRCSVNGCSRSAVGKSSDTPLCRAHKLENEYGPKCKGPKSYPAPRNPSQNQQAIELAQTHYQQQLQQQQRQLHSQLQSQNKQSEQSLEVAIPFHSFDSQTTNFGDLVGNHSSAQQDHGTVAATQVSTEHSPELVGQHPSLKRSRLDAETDIAHQGLNESTTVVGI